MPLASPAGRAHSEPMRKPAAKAGKRAAQSRAPTVREPPLSDTKGALQMGFYILKCAENVNSKTKESKVGQFVFSNNTEFCRTLDLQVAEQPFCIVPCTFKPNQTGKFKISVMSSAICTLQPTNPASTPSTEVPPEDSLIGMGRIGRTPQRALSGHPKRPTSQTPSASRHRAQSASRTTSHGPAKPKVGMQGLINMYGDLE
uniref:Peptidase C2 calpain large subunit domain-containing protein n=1 Tax=Eutreptiella gymnastica TaxID=73025 RepID=A0A7S1I4X1_9EUGL